jgi:hypothetical protein
MKKKKLFINFNLNIIKKGGIEKEKNDLFFLFKTFFYF